jgi:predicted transcriptional regulator
MDDIDSDRAASDELVITLTKRGDVMSELADGCKRKREIAESISVSRSTVHRSLERLQELGLVEESSDGYELTGYGRTAFRAHQSFLERASRFRESRELLTEIPSEYAFPSMAFEDVDVVQPEPFALDRPVVHIEELLGDVTELVWWAPTVTGQLLEVLTEEATAGTLDGTVTLTEEVVSKLRAERPALLEGLCRAEGTTLEKTTSGLPFGLLVVEQPDPTVCVVVHDDAGVRGLLRSDHQQVVTWARDHLSNIDSTAVGYGADEERSVPAE